jgi:hypothetical protein
MMPKGMEHTRPSGSTLHDKYIATGLATERDLELYGAFTAEKACWATYHATVRVSGRKPGHGDVR